MQSVVRQFRQKAKDERARKHDAKHGPEATKKLSEYDWMEAIDELSAARDLFTHVESQLLEHDFRGKRNG